MLDDKYNIHRFLEAQISFGIYNRAVSELEKGKKRSHWIWFVFPQMKGLVWYIAIIPTSMALLVERRRRLILLMKR